jgi:hypothetical protein
MIHADQGFDGLLDIQRSNKKATFLSGFFMGVRYFFLSLG